MNNSSAPERLLLLLTMPVFCLFCLELRADLGLVYRTPGTPVGHIPTLTGKVENHHQLKSAGNGRGYVISLPGRVR